MNAPKKRKYVAPAKRRGNGASATDQQRREFAAMHLQGTPATECYRQVFDAKGNPNTCRKQAHLILHHPAMQAVIEELRAQMHEKVSTNLNEWLASTLRPLRFDPARLYDEHGNFLPVRDMDLDTRACIESIEAEEWQVDDVEVAEDGTKKTTTTTSTRTKKIKFRSRDGAEERLGKYHGVYKKDNEQQAPRLFDVLPRDLQQALYERLGSTRSAS